jgi:threonine/homoserine/homoserine lactone efflux protein
VVSLSNPYWTLWWATLGVALVTKGLEFGLVGIVTFFLGHISSDFAWYTFVSYGVARGRGVISEKVYHAVLAICGWALLAFGLWFLVSGCIRAARLLMD